jgi:hypothetical protein
MERIIGAFTFQRRVYQDVEEDSSFTPTAWGIVVVIAFLSQLGIYIADGVVSGLIGAAVGTIFQVIGFALGALVISWVGKSLFNAQVTFEEMVRTLGLAYVWNIVGVLGVLAAISPALSCILAPITCLAPILGLVSWFIATQEALDLELGQTIITVILGWIIQVAFGFLTGLILGLLGFTAGAVGDILSR